MHSFNYFHFYSFDRNIVNALSPWGYINAFCTKVFERATAGSLYRTLFIVNFRFLLIDLQHEDLLFGLGYERDWCRTFVLNFLKRNWLTGWLTRECYRSRDARISALFLFFIIAYHRGNRIYGSLFMVLLIFLWGTFIFTAYTRQIRIFWVKFLIPTYVSEWPINVDRFPVNKMVCLGQWLWWHIIDIFHCSFVHKCSLYQLKLCKETKLNTCRK